MKIELKSKMIMVEKPSLPETKVVLTEEAQKSIEAELVKKYVRLKVLKTASDCSFVKDNDEVYIQPGNFNENTLVTYKDKLYYAIHENNVLYVYKD